jgi:hypothetical protein
MSNTVSAHMKLMRSMGAKSYDPIPPDQFLCFLDKDVRLTPTGHRAHAWLQSKTIHSPGGSRHRTPQARDVRGDLHLTEMSIDLRIDLPAATRAWEELEREGIGRRDEQGRLWLCGTVKKQEGRTDGKVEKDELCTYKLPERFRLYLQTLDQKQAAQGEQRYLLAARFGEQLEADAIKAARAQKQEVFASVFAEVGFVDEEPRGRRPESRELVVKLSLASTFDDFCVHTSARESVQNGNGQVYANGNGGVHNSASLLDSKQSFRVSKEATSGRGPDPIPTPPPTPLKTKDRKNPPGESCVPQPKSEVIRTIKSLMGKELAEKDPLRAKFDGLAERFGIPERSVCRFFCDKVDAKRVARYPIHHLGALYQMAEKDLPKWIENNGDPIYRDLRDQERSRQSETVLPGAEAPEDSEAGPLQGRRDPAAEVAAEVKRLKSMHASRGGEE